MEPQPIRCVKYTELLSPYKEVRLHTGPCKHATLLGFVATSGGIARRAIVRFGVGATIDFSVAHGWALTKEVREWRIAPEDINRMQKLATEAGFLVRSFQRDRPLDFRPARKPVNAADAPPVHPKQLGLFS